MYLLWVRGNLANGRMGELNFITYIFLKGPTSVFVESISSARWSIFLAFLDLLITDFTSVYSL
jgi:hypothetical protein